MNSHMVVRHGISIRVYRQALTSNTIDLLRTEHGFTTTLNQCGWCLEIFDNPYRFGRHRNKCEKRPTKFDDRLKELSQERMKSLPKSTPKSEYTGAKRGRGRPKGSFKIERINGIPRNTKGVSYQIIKLSSKIHFSSI